MPFFWGRGQATYTCFPNFFLTWAGIRFYVARFFSAQETDPIFSGHGQARPAPHDLFPIFLEVCRNQFFLLQK